MPAVEQAPVISLGANGVVAPVVRTALQGAIVNGGLRLLMVVPDPDLTISDGDQAIITLIGLAAVAFVMNFLEQWKGRQLLGRSPAPAIAPPDHV